MAENNVTINPEVPENGEVSTPPVAQHEVGQIKLMDNINDIMNAFRVVNSVRRPNSDFKDYFEALLTTIDIINNVVSEIPLRDITVNVVGQTNRVYTVGEYLDKMGAQFAKLIIETCVSLDGTRASKIMANVKVGVKTEEITLKWRPAEIGKAVQLIGSYAQATDYGIQEWKSEVNAGAAMAITTANVMNENMDCRSSVSIPVRISAVASGLFGPNAFHNYWEDWNDELFKSVFKFK